MRREQNLQMPEDTARKIARNLLQELEKLHRMSQAAGPEDLDYIVYELDVLVEVARSLVDAFHEKGEGVQVRPRRRFG